MYSKGSKKTKINIILRKNKVTKCSDHGKARKRKSCIHKNKKYHHTTSGSIPLNRTSLNVFWSYSKWKPL